MTIRSTIRATIRGVIAPTVIGMGCGSVQPILHLEGDDAAFSGGTLTSWTAEIGPSASPKAGNEPTEGATANGRQGVRFTSATPTRLDVGNVKDSASDYTIQIVWQNHRWGGNRQYALRSYTTVDTDDLVIAHASNLSSSRYTGFYDATEGTDSNPGSGWHWFHRDNWRGNSIVAIPDLELHVDTYVLSGGATALYRNGELIGSGTQYTQRKMHDLVIGAYKDPATGDCVDPDATALDATIYQVKVWGQALGAATVTTEQTAAMSRFGITEPSERPEDIFSDDLVGLFDASDPYYLEYDGVFELSAAANRAGSSTFTGFGTSPSMSVGELGEGLALFSSGAEGLRDDTIATAAYPNGYAEGTVTMFAVFIRDTVTGSTGGSIAAFGLESASNPRFEMQLNEPGTPGWVRSVQLDDDGGLSRGVLSSSEPGDAGHLVTAEQDESSDKAKVTMDGVVDTGSLLNQGTASLDTFSIGARRGNGAYTGGNKYAHIGAVGVVNRAITSSEITRLRAWANHHWGTP